MTNWYEVPCGRVLLAEMNAIAPFRDHSSDGTIGDAAHTTGDHVPDAEGAVRAVDIDNGPAVGENGITVSLESDEPGLTMETVVQFLLSRCRAGLEERITYIIYYERIWAQDNGWRQVAYHGSSPHKEHAHFSFSHNDRLANNTSSFHLEDIPMPITDGDIDKIAQRVVTLFTTDHDAGEDVDTTLGHFALSQEVPDVTQNGTPQVAYYQVFENYGKLLMAIRDSLAAIENKLGV